VEQAAPKGPAAQIGVRTRPGPRASAGAERPGRRKRAQARHRAPGRDRPGRRAREPRRGRPATEGGPPAARGEGRQRGPGESGPADRKCKRDDPRGRKTRALLLHRGHVGRGEGRAATREPRTGYGNGGMTRPMPKTRARKKEREAAGRPTARPAPAGAERTPARIALVQLHSFSYRGVTSVQRRQAGVAPAHRAPRERCGAADSTGPTRAGRPRDQGPRSQCGGRNRPGPAGAGRAGREGPEKGRGRAGQRRERRAGEKGRRGEHGPGQ